MQINSIKNVNQKSNLPFKSNMSFDIGGSQREGSCKIYYATSNNDDVIYTAQTTVNAIGKRTFENTQDFINQIVKKVKKVQDTNKTKVEEMGYPEKENTLKSLTVFIPSYTSKAYAYYLPNHKNREDRPLKDLDFSNIKEMLENNGVKVSEDFKFRLLQDAMGAGLATAKNLYDNGMLKKGKYYTACITGGGCGIANIEMTDDEHVTIKSSGSGYLSGGSALQKVSKAGASAPAVIQNFCRAFGLNEEMVEDIKNCHLAEFTISNPVSYKKDLKTLKLKELLLDTGKYEVAQEDDEQFTLKIKDEYLNLYDRSRRSAIDKYCLAFARFAIIKKTEGSNGIIITGPLARAINKSAKENYGIGISRWVTDHLLSSFNTYELDKMQKTYNFTIFCDERFFIDNNTASKKYAHKSEFISPERGNWIKLSIDALKDNPKLEN